jgi:hypothetical protein
MEQLMLLEVRRIKLTARETKSKAPPVMLLEVRRIKSKVLETKSKAPPAMLLVKPKTFQIKQKVPLAIFQKPTVLPLAAC